MKTRGGRSLGVNLAISESQKSQNFRRLRRRFTLINHDFRSTNLKIFAAYGGVLPLQIPIFISTNLKIFSASGGILPLQITILRSKNLKIFAAHGGVLLLQITIFEPQVHNYQIDPKCMISFRPQVHDLQLDPKCMTLSLTPSA